MTPVTLRPGDVTLADWRAVYPKRGSRNRPGRRSNAWGG